jgi:hypothetical protein
VAGGGGVRIRDHRHRRTGCTVTGYVCSNDRCGRAWSPGSGQPAPAVPVVERRPGGDRHWYPCPSCLDDDAGAALLAHRLRERTALELSGLLGG